MQSDCINIELFRLEISRDTILGCPAGMYGERDSTLCCMHGEIIAAM